MDAFKTKNFRVLDRVSRETLEAQLKKLDVDFQINRQNIQYLQQRFLIPRPYSQPGQPLEFWPETAAEIYANRKVAVECQLTYDHIGKIRQMGIDYWTEFFGFTYERFAEVVNTLSVRFKGKEFYAVPTMSWLYNRHIALVELYGEEVVDWRPLLGSPELLVDFITYLCRGSLRGWTMTPRGKLVPPKGVERDHRVDKIFSELTERPAMAAKSRD
jgi:hypothetical protein